VRAGVLVIGRNEEIFRKSQYVQYIVDCGDVVLEHLWVVVSYLIYLFINICFRLGSLHTLGRCISLLAKYKEKLSETAGNRSTGAPGSRQSSRNSKRASFTKKNSTVGKSMKDTNAATHVPYRYWVYRWKEESSSHL